jgi:phage/plasmid-associated DNA primase
VTLSDQHRQKLRSSALSEEQINALGWSSLHTGSLLIPYIKPDGSPELCHGGQPFTRERLSQKQIDEQRRKGNSKPGKYRSPKGEGCRIYHSALAIRQGNYGQRISNRFVPLRITEGEIKTEAAAVHDPERITIGLGGVSSWQDRYDNRPDSMPLVDFDEFHLERREVRLCFDSDLHKPQVASGLRKLAEFLQEKGARVLIEVLPNGLDGDRLGVDDLIHRHGAGAFLAIAAIARPPFTKKGEWEFRPEPANTCERNVYLAGMHGRCWRTSRAGNDRWHQWTGTHWIEVEGHDEILKVIEQFAQLQGWHNRESHTIRSLREAFRRTVEQGLEHAAPGLLPFRNGCLRLDDRRLIPHQPEHGNSWYLPYDYDPAADCDGIQALLQDRLGDAANVALLRAFARALVVGERLKCFLEITGPSNTGKSVLANLLVALVGHDNTAAGKLERLEDHGQRFETAKFCGKRLAIFSECQSYGGQLQTLKALTGGDPIAGEVKGGRHFEFTFHGGVVLVGNGPIRPSDPTGAVINRRRSLHVEKVVAAADERQLLDADGAKGWRGELVAELPGLVNWCLSMPEKEARQALARDVRSVCRAEADLRTLLDSDHLAEWADRCLVWDEAGHVRVGTPDSPEDKYAYASYAKHVHEQGTVTRPLSVKVFKQKLVDLLRDTLGLPLPPGDLRGGDYRQRGVGSVVPCLRWRTAADETGDAPGVVRQGFMARAEPTPPAADAERIGTDRERIGNGKTPVGNGWNGWNGSKGVGQIEENGQEENPYTGSESDLSVPPVPSVPQKGSQRSASVPHPPRSVPDPLHGPQSGPTATRPKPIKVDGQPGWGLPAGVMPRGDAPTVQVLVVDPKGVSRQVERRRIELDVRSSQEAA